ncbi:MAG TPA: glycosyltransferase [Acidimicrobiia bacterium]|nr:glycosyltransferase [Acidimicrobiia bacterium]
MGVGDDGGAPARRRVLLVEEWAHRAEGHFPILFADLATGFSEMGCTVDVLVQRGWVHDDDWGRPVPFAIHRYRRLGRMSSRLGGLVGNASADTRVGRLSRALGSMLRGRVAAREVRALERRLGRHLESVIVTSLQLDPLAVAAFGGRRSWLVFEYFSPLVRVPIFSGVLARLARRGEAKRRRSGDRVRVVTAGESTTREWADRVPFLEPATALLAPAGSRNGTAGARERLHLDADDRVALLFGAGHEFKDPSVVWRAFSELDTWRLAVGGSVASILPPTPSAAQFARAPVVNDGHVSARDRDAYFAAADLVVLSFRPDTAVDSGTLMDAITWGVPVVCSARSVAADVVTEHRLGVLFEPGDEVSLRAAVRAAPSRIAPSDLERARQTLSRSATAARLLGLLDPD